MLRRLEEHKIGLQVSPAAKDILARDGYDPQFGARPLKRLIQKKIQDPMALKLLKGEVRDGQTIMVEGGKEGLVISVSP